uniref:ethanolamine kinase n=1 Tax=Ditylenchus dipsaci TaxID=166011 RepID=A0A915EC30_9BILA
MPENSKVPFYDIEISMPSNSKPCPQFTKLLSKLKPEWNVDTLKFKTFTNGITNKIFRVSYEGDSERLVFRVFGQGSSKIINREQELESFNRLSEYGIGTPVLARFINGIVCGYLEGECLDVQTVRQPHIVEKICSALAKMHQIPPKNGEELPEPFIYSKIAEYFEVIPESFEDTKQKIYDDYFVANGVVLKDDFRQLKQKLDNLTEELKKLVFCHNDLLVFNILYDPDKDQIHFIDYEYAAYNFQLFDIANHFCEYAGVVNPDYNLCPSQSEKREFLQKYLRHFNSHDSSDTDQSLDDLLAVIPLFEAASHLFWCLWALAQSHLSVIEFDYMRYAVLRHKQFKKLHEI